MLGCQLLDYLCECIVCYFDLLLFWYLLFESGLIDVNCYLFVVIMQWLMVMYYLWDLQNVWLWQIYGENYLFVNLVMVVVQQIDDGVWIYVELLWGKVCCCVCYSEVVEFGIVWIWNVIGKVVGVWNFGFYVGELQCGFLFNYVIIDELFDVVCGGVWLLNFDLVIGQVGWYDVQVWIYLVEVDVVIMLLQFVLMLVLLGMLCVL